MHIVHIASEMAPFVKVGGLGDALSGLCRQQAKCGHQVTAILPKYDLISDTCLARARLLAEFIFCKAGPDEYHCRVWRTQWNGVQVLWIDSHHPGKYFERQRVYGCDDDVNRFVSFCASVAQLFRQWGTAPDLFHLHDWHTASFSLLGGSLKPAPAAKTPCVLTVHNFDHQGLIDFGTLRHFHIPMSQIPHEAWQHSGVNILRAAILRTRCVTTVSPNYCREVQTPLGGRGLDSLLQKRARESAFEGVLNGIDTTYWTPKDNAYLPLAFDKKSLVFSSPDRPDCDQKRELKGRLAQRLGLPESRGPWVVCVTRLVPQKGLDLIEHALKKTLQAGGTFLLIGSSPIPAVQRHFEELRGHLRGSENARIILNYEESLAHWLFATGDLIIVPSLFEPCGLTQMIGMRFGTIPVVRKTGGLADTVFDFEQSAKPRGQRNGFTFELPTSRQLEETLMRAFGIYRNSPETWQRWVQQVMNLDYSWRQPAEHYQLVYRRALGLPVRQEACDKSTWTDEEPFLAALP